MKPKENCRQLLSYLSEFIDDELEDQQLCAEIEAHLDQCKDCQVVVDTMKKTITLYNQSADQTELPSPVRRRLFQRLDLKKYLPD